MRQRLSPYMLLVVVVGIATMAVVASAKDETNSAAQAMVNRFADSWNRADGTAYGENYWPDAELVDPTGVIVTGREAIVKEHIDLWAGIFKGTHQKVTIRRVRVLCPDYMVVDFDAFLSDMKALPPGAAVDSQGVLTAHLKHIMQKRHGEWKIVLAQNTLVAAPQSGK
jgi:uncharacterized protein (TIGR02246 family)